MSVAVDAPVMANFAVRLVHGPGWDPSRRSGTRTAGTSTRRSWTSSSMMASLSWAGRSATGSRLCTLSRRPMRTKSGRGWAGIHGLQRDAPGRNDPALGALARRPPRESGALTDSQRIPYRYLTTETQCGVSGKSVELCRWLLYGGKDWQQRRDRVVQVFLETQRLVLRRFTVADADDLVSLDADSDVMRFATGGVPMSATRSRTTSCPPSSVITSGTRASGSGRPWRRRPGNSWAGSISGRARTPSRARSSLVTGCASQLGARGMPPRGRAR